MGKHIDMPLSEVDICGVNETSVLTFKERSTTSTTIKDTNIKILADNVLLSSLLTLAKSSYVLY